MLESISRSAHVIDYGTLSIDKDLSYIEEPPQILDRKDQRLRTKSIPLVKVPWRNHSRRRQLGSAKRRYETSILTYSIEQAAEWRSLRARALLSGRRTSSMHKSLRSLAARARLSSGKSRSNSGTNRSLAARAPLERLGFEEREAADLEREEGELSPEPESNPELVIMVKARDKEGTIAVLGAWYKEVTIAVLGAWYKEVTIAVLGAWYKEVTIAVLGAWYKEGTMAVLGAWHKEGTMAILGAWHKEENNMKYRLMFYRYAILQ
ncbi:hypothetical protein Nepgr_026735 [Nepenthes gracilis]|uniref:Uncharacterized protein n=1 Tax=Nepenthes gracilis TaxID=150966 RepID=A0AAD3T8R0_NEPGR|nr:hypothetical protein Nepgr_026735 [Nepenthes gracilis]